MTKDEALRLALEALEEYTSVVTSVNDPNTWIKVADGGKPAREAITAIKAALEAKDEPEYYGLTKDHLWMSISKEHYDRLKPEFRMACYTIPPQRKPLTIGQIMGLAIQHGDAFNFEVIFARAIEAAHGITGDNK